MIVSRFSIHKIYNWQLFWQRICENSEKYFVGEAACVKKSKERGVFYKSVASCEGFITSLLIKHSDFNEIVNSFY